MEPSLSFDPMSIFKGLVDFVTLVTHMPIVSLAAMLTEAKTYDELYRNSAGYSALQHGDACCDRHADGSGRSRRSIPGGTATAHLFDDRGRLARFATC